MPQHDATPLGERLSRCLPPSLGLLLNQRAEFAPIRSTLPEPGLIPGAHASPELACIVDLYDPALVPADAISEVKIDGLRALYIASRIYTREGSAFEAAEHCLSTLRALERFYGEPMFFDGEYVEDGGLEATNAAFRSRKGAGVLWLFDAVPLKEWQSGKPSSETLEQRKLRLRSALLSIGEDEAPCVGFLESTAGMTPATIEQRLLSVCRRGYEGLVIKSASSRYVRKRTCDWMKVKLRSVSRMVICEVVGCQRPIEVVEDGLRKTVMEDQMKTLLVRHPSVDSDGRPQRPVKVPIGGGGLAATLWRERAKLIGSTCEIEHSGFTGAGNPREPLLNKVTI